MKGVLVIFISILFLAFGEDVLVTIPDGTLRGFLSNSSKVSFYAFLKVPFAQPPVGKLRFQSPQPSQKWKGILDATSNSDWCIQTTTDNHRQSEDCLYLNIYTNKHPSSNKSLPVIFYIYGGGFMTGYNDIAFYGPQMLMEHDVVIVVPNYRVGAFGFLSTGDTVIPGNNGLKDQLLALQWVNKNIQYFNGDPNKVTLMGLSAGGISATYHMMSEKSRGLFRAVIAQSGTVLIPPGYQRDRIHYAYGLAYNLNPSFKTNATTQELLEYLQSVTAEELRNATNAFPEPTYNLQMLQGYWFTPTVEPEHEGAFLTELQYSAIKNGHTARVPLLMGINSEELVLYAYNKEEYSSLLKYFDNNITALVNHNMKIKDPILLAKVGGLIRKIYTPTTFQDNPSSLVKCFSDSSFGKGLITHASLQSQYSDVYFYKFSYYRQILNYTNDIPEIKHGVAHGMDLFFIWDMGARYIDKFTAKDLQTSLRYRTLIINFVTYLKPTPEKSELFGNLIWPKVTSNNVSYFNINDTISIETNPRGDAIAKWVQLYEQYAVKPYDTF